MQNWGWTPTPFCNNFAIPISIHCWQGDDVAGFEGVADEIGGGLAVTGNYPGKARTRSNSDPISTWRCP